MSSHLYAESGVTQTVHCDQDNKDNLVDIYVSAQSLRVLDNPWVESTSPPVPASVGARQPASLVCESSGQRSHVRADTVFLGVVCLLLLVGLICLGAQKTAERNRLLDVNAELMITTDQLKVNNTKLSSEREKFYKALCENKKCGNKSVTECQD